MEKRSIRLGLVMINLNRKEEKIPEEFKKIAKDFSEKGFITTSSENLIKATYKQYIVSI